MTLSVINNKPGEKAKTGKKRSRKGLNRNVSGFIGCDLREYNQNKKFLFKI
jgi:hypothetical protein